jgi:hypothetical protein
VYKLKKRGNFSFPNNVQIEVYLESTEQFGIIEESHQLQRLSKTLTHRRPTSIRYNANTGKQGVIHSKPPFKPIRQNLDFANLKMEIKGNKLYVRTKCQDIISLDRLMIFCHYLLPIIINLEFIEPPTVRYTRGRVGEIDFNWELQTALGTFDVTTKENQEKRIATSFFRSTVISGTENRRLAVALYHFYVARRLIESGNSPYEFLAEYILNLDKVLKILFGEKRDNVRSELAKFGYSSEEIEEKFLPIMILRNEFDVGHVSMRIFKQEQLNILYQYFDMTDKDFRDLLKRVFQKLEDGDYVLQQDPDLNLKGTKLQVMKKLIVTINKKVSKSVS